MPPMHSAIILPLPSYDTTKEHRETYNAYNKGGIGEPNTEAYDVDDSGATCCTARNAGDFFGDWSE